MKLTGESGFYEMLDRKTSQLVGGIIDAAKSFGVALSANHVGGMFGLFFTDSDSVTSFQNVMACDGEQFNRFFHGMLERGIYLAPSAFEAGFVSRAHSEDDLKHTVNAAQQVFAEF